MRIEEKMNSVLNAWLLKLHDKHGSLKEEAIEEIDARTSWHIFIREIKFYRILSITIYVDDKIVGTEEITFCTWGAATEPDEHKFFFVHAISKQEFSQIAINRINYFLQHYDCNFYKTILVEGKSDWHYAHMITYKSFKYYIMLESTDYTRNFIVQHAKKGTLITLETMEGITPIGESFQEEWIPVLI